MPQTEDAIDHATEIAGSVEGDGVTSQDDALDKVEEQFTQHCNDIIGSDCTAAEKANFITYLMTEKTPSEKK